MVFIVSYAIEGDANPQLCLAAVFGFLLSLPREKVIPLLGKILVPIAPARWIDETKRTSASGFSLEG